jgi:hypothetical protein
MEPKRDKKTKKKMNENIVLLLLLLSRFRYRKAFRSDGRVIANKVCNDGNHEYNSADMEQGQRVGRDVVHKSIA